MVLAAALVLFAWERWRYDMVALGALLVLVLVGIVPGDEAFTGFGHPGVVTVAAVLVIGRGFQNSGLVELVAGWLARAGNRPTAQVAATSGLTALFSSFMNNVGAVALLMPVTIRMAHSADNPRSLLLMPLAFSSLLGGLVTVMGTPPNIVIANARTATGEPPFAMFEFAPVGLGVAVAGLAYLALVGWRLIPRRESGVPEGPLFHVAAYATEVRVPERAQLAGESVRRLGIEYQATVVAITRGNRHIPAPGPWESLRPDDLLVVQADAEGLAALIERGGLELTQSKAIDREQLGSDDIAIAEAVIQETSPLVGRTAIGLNVRGRYGVNILGIARHGESIRQRVSRVPLRAGDVLLVQGPFERLPVILSELGCLPLAERGLRLARPRSTLVAVLLLAAALVSVAGLRIMPIQVALMLTAVVMGAARFVTLREAYEAINWPVLVLLGAMIPVGDAVETTGLAARAASGLASLIVDMPAWAGIAVVLVVTMVTTDVLNNVAAAVLAAPIAIGTAERLGVSADPFLMAVAIGASCSCLTPLGHQSNTLVMGPGGYRFSDYWRVGLPLEIVITIVAVPLILLFWPP